MLNRKEDDKMARDAIARTGQPQSLVQSDRRPPPIAPSCDIYENEEEILLIADLPGVTAESLAVHLDKGELTIDARREVSAQQTSTLAAEYAESDYRRRFVVPSGIDGNKINAELKNGVLQLHLPKSEALKPRQIAVRSG
jgi:HSP20 family protein